jgi:hypothetical protein
MMNIWIEKLIQYIIVMENNSSIIVYYSSKIVNNNRLIVSGFLKIRGFNRDPKRLVVFNMRLYPH